MNGVKERESQEYAYRADRNYKKGSNGNKKTKLIVAILAITALILAIILLKQFFGKPDFKLIGEETVEIEYGTEYKDAGATAKAKFSDISNKIVVESNVDTSKLGTYKVTYKVPRGKKYDTYTRTVIVKDTQAPIITLKGEDNVEIDFGKKYEDEGVEKVEDGYDGELSVDNVAKEEKKLENGDIEIHYTISDSSSNKADKVRYIKVVDKTAPEIKLNGKAFVSLKTNEEFKDEGATATDTKDGDLTSKITKEGSVDTSKDGKYTITYKVKDNNGNEATAQRTIFVGQTQATGVIYLTFDDGPSANTTPRILDTLKEKGVNATFFIINYSDANEHLVKRAISEGNAIGIHGYSHDYKTIYSSLDAYYQNITKLQEKIEKTTGKKVMITRFPGGASNTVSRKYCSGVVSAASKKLLENGFKYFDWNVASGDSGDVQTADAVYRNVTNGIKPGRNNIVLMHDFSGNNKTAEALPRIIDWGLANGYRFEVITTETEMITQKIQN